MTNNFLAPSLPIYHPRATRLGVEWESISLVAARKGVRSARLRYILSQELRGGNVSYHENSTGTDGRSYLRRELMFCRHRNSKITRVCRALRHDQALFSAIYKKTMLGGATNAVHFFLPKARKLTCARSLAPWH